jgi:hypothetical protein
MSMKVCKVNNKWEELMWKAVNDFADEFADVKRSDFQIHCEQDDPPMLFTELE